MGLYIYLHTHPPLLVLKRTTKELINLKKKKKLEGMTLENKRESTRKNVTTSRKKKKIKIKTRLTLSPELQNFRLRVRTVAKK